ncbi:hypothetical protein ABPG75_000219 [Micractinium tetrahymenae]
MLSSLRPAPAALAGCSAPRGRRGALVVRASSGGQDADDQPLPQVPKQRRRSRRKEKPAEQPFSIDTLNPVTMGRKSREVFDDVWTQLQRIGNPTRSSQVADTFTQLVDVPEYESPDAPSTTVLVTGATGRVGRVLVRKLLLRGYKVRALVRTRRDGGSATGGTAASSSEGEGEGEAFPQSVELVYGDVGDYQACRAAVEGVDKIVCCSGARSTITADLSRVEEQGVANLARALLDAQNARARREGRLAPTAKRELADFRREEHHEAWDIVSVGPPQAEEEPKSKGRRRAAERARARDSAECYINKDDNLVFEGAVYSRGGSAEVGAPLQLPAGESLQGAEGLVLRLRSDEHAYTCVLRAAGGMLYTNRFGTRTGYNTLRLPFNTFRPVNPEDPPLRPDEIEYLGLRFEPRIKVLEQVTEPGQSMFDTSANRFRLEVDWVKALPGGIETDFILVSCAGTPRPDLDDAQREKVVTAKRRGEAILRNSGLGYTIVRPGPLVEEAGGYKALVFDQGNRITQGISCADVADICLKAINNPEARNKTFEVCFEYEPEEGLEFYELISHLPDKSNSYLTPALSPLTKNT